MSCGGERFSASNRFGGETRLGRRVDGRNGLSPRQEQNAASPDKSHYEYCDPNASNHCIPTSLSKCRGTRLFIRITHVLHHREATETKH